MPQMKFYLLGMPYVEVDSRVIELSRRKALALLAYLAVSSQRCSRDTLATLLWPDQDNQQARAGLRRVLAVINESPIQRWIAADRDTIALRKDAAFWIDLDEFNRLAGISSPTLQELEAAAGLYRGDFMAGFTLRDSSAFDAWQSIQAQLLQQKCVNVYRQLARQHLQSNDSEKGILVLRRWLSIDSTDEAAHRDLMRAYALSGQRAAALRQYEICVKQLQEELAASPDAETVALYNAIKADQPLWPQKQPEPIFGFLPHVPQLVIGREEVLKGIKARLADALASPHDQSVALAIQGWPGIGKTTTTAQLAHDSDVIQLFPDGILWASLGESPNLISLLANWIKALGGDETEGDATIEALTVRLASLLRDRRMLLIIDDVWEIQHAAAFRVGGRGCASIYTTRMNDIARQLAGRPESICKLPILAEHKSIELLRMVCPEISATPIAEVRELIRDLEGLPLALQVAGRLLHAELQMGWGVGELLQELRHGAALLKAQAPPDRYEISQQTTPTIAVLLQRSIDRLPSDLREQFALLAVFAPKPATFDLEAMQAVWLVEDAKPAARILVDRGLLEPVGGGRFQIHALLVMQARSMFQE